MKLEMAIYAVVRCHSGLGLADCGLLSYNEGAFSHKMHPIVVKLLPKEAPGSRCQPRTLLVSNLW